MDICARCVFKMFVCAAVLAVISASLTIVGTDDTSAVDEPVSISRIQVLVGDVAKLICDLRSEISDDRVTLLIWYKHNNDTPIYKFDMRGHDSNTNAIGRNVGGSSGGSGGGNGASQWADKQLGERAYLRVQGAVRPEEALLVLENVGLEDEGEYRCRVDFRHSPTRNSLVNLTIVEPIRELVIIDWSGRPLRGEMSQPLPEGASANITCIAYGGKPLARISWWRGDELVDDVDELLEERRVTRNVLRIARVTRRDVLAAYTCEAANTVLRPPISKRVIIEMYLRPLDVRLIGVGAPLSASARHEITCRTRGSRPPANVTWWKDGFLMGDADIRETVSDDGNVTVSTLMMMPQVADQGMTLSCRANNPHIPHSELRDTTMLHVLYVPQVALSLGSNLNASNIREGVDVYFECHITANPWVHRVTWWHNGRQLHNNVSAGVIVSNQTLVIQGVSRATAGMYSCVAANSQGDTESNAVQLDVKYEPICGSNPRTVYGAARMEQIFVGCVVDGNPPATLFRWTFNHTPAGDSRDLTTFSVDAGGGRSVAVYRPVSERDYGTLLCWGRNELGGQRRPCSFHIVPAGKPDPPFNCTLTNRTHHSLSVTCRRGFDGGLSQRFTMIVMTEDKVVANITSGAIPEFAVTGLEPEITYSTSVYAYNEKGHSRSTKPLVVRTLPQILPNEQRKIAAPTAAPSSSAIEMHPWVYIGMGVLVSLVVTALVLAIVLHWWYNESKYTCCAICTNDSSSSTKNSVKSADEADAAMSIALSAGLTPKKGVCTSSRNGSTDPLRSIAEDEEEKNPDLIPPDLYYRQLYSPNNLSYTISPCQVISYDGRLEVLPISTPMATYLEESAIPTPVAATSSTSSIGVGTTGILRSTPHTWQRENSLPLATPSSSVGAPQPLVKWSSEVPIRELSVNVDNILCTPGALTSDSASTSLSNVSKQHAETQTPLLRHKESSV